jgi:hypothetical protein
MMRRTSATRANDRTMTHNEGDADSPSAALKLFVIGSSVGWKFWREVFGVRVGELTRVLRVQFVHTILKSLLIATQR